MKQIEVLKSQLVGALGALGQVICRTSPVEAYRSLRITGLIHSIKVCTLFCRKTPLLVGVTMGLVFQ